MLEPRRSVDEQLRRALSDLETARAQAASLEAGLESNRRIGMAVGILMERHRLTSDQAFALLVDASQRQNLKLRELADRMTVSGSLDD
ncbi:MULTISPECIES: ANTAR domain-containing protein [unclassified Blastococcus]